jgi:hypothetical protein
MTRTGIALEAQCLSLSCFLDGAACQGHWPVGSRLLPHHTFRATGITAHLENGGVIERLAALSRLLSVSAS